MPYAIYPHTAANTVVYPPEFDTEHGTSIFHRPGFEFLNLCLSAAPHHTSPDDKERKARINRDLIGISQLLVDSYDQKTGRYEIHRYIPDHYVPAATDESSVMAICMVPSTKDYSADLELYNTIDPLMQKRVGPIYAFHLDLSDHRKDYVHSIFETVPVTMGRIAECAPSNEWHRPQNRRGEYRMSITKLTKLAEIIIERDPRVEGMKPATMKRALQKLFATDTELSGRYFQPDAKSDPYHVYRFDIQTIEDQPIIEDAKQRFIRKSGN